MAAPKNVAPATSERRDSFSPTAESSRWRWLISSLPCRSVQRFDRKRDALAAADAKSNQAALQAVAAHRVDQLGGQHRAGRADRVAVRNSAALDIDDFVGQSELARHDNGDRREGLI